MRSAKREKITPVTRIANQKPPSVASAIVFERKVGAVVASMMTRIITNCLFVTSRDIIFLRFYFCRDSAFYTRDGFLFQLKKPRIFGPKTNPGLKNR